MILLEIQCPHCRKAGRGGLQKWLSYHVKRREQLFHKQATCKVCGRGFLIKGSEVNRIVKELRFKP